MVSSDGAPSEAIGNAGVPVMATPNVGDITVCPSLPLVKHVIHTQWKSGKGEMVSVCFAFITSICPIIHLVCPKKFYKISESKEPVREKIEEIIIIAGVAQFSLYVHMVYL